MSSPTLNLTFHGVGPAGRELDPGEAAVWVDLPRFHAMLDAVAARPAAYRVTFDDGNASDVAHALPALRERRLTGTFFVVAARIGTPGYLDRDGVRELLGAGMAIGSHGMRHRPWRALGDDALREELIDARRELEAAAGRPIDQAACPFGSYDRRVLRALRAAGYRRVFTSDRGPARRGDWLQARTTLRAADDPAVVRTLARRRGPAHAAARRIVLTAKRWR